MPAQSTAVPDNFLVVKPARNLQWLVRHRFGAIRLASFLGCLAPAAWLITEWLTDSLGVNPLNRLLHFTGRWALIMLLVTLTVTPARRLSVWLSQTSHAHFGKRLSDWNWLIRLRRQLGLFAFFYACLHLAIYAGLDAGFDLGAILDDAHDRPFILLGFSGFALLVPLAATSNAYAIRTLGRHWQKLHSATYVIAILAIAHFWMQMKLGHTTYLPYALVLALLFAARILVWKRGDRGVVVEAKER